LAAISIIERVRKTESAFIAIIRIGGIQLGRRRRLLAPGKNLAIHQVLLRFFALQGGKIPCPAGIIRL